MKHIETKIERNVIFQKCACGVSQRIGVSESGAKDKADYFLKKHKSCGRKSK